MQTQDNSFVLKHRIVGAAILIFFGALFLPWLLGNPKSIDKTPAVLDPMLDYNAIYDASLVAAEQAEVDDSEVEENIQVYVSKITPLIDPVSTNKKSVEEKAKPVASKSEPIAEKPKPKPPAVKQEVVTKPKVEEPKADKDIKVGWIVSVGVFSKQGNVDAIMADLKKKGFKPSLSKTETSKGLGTRVWLGPYSQRVDAAKARTKLKNLIGGEPGAIIAYP